MLIGYLQHCGEGVSAGAVNSGDSPAEVVLEKTWDLEVLVLRHQHVCKI